MKITLAPLTSFKSVFIFNCFPPTKAIYTPTCQFLKKGNNEWIVNLTP